MIDRVESFLRRCRRRLSLSELAASRLGRPVAEAPGVEPGLLLIQIDGLARRQLERALARRRMPFLRSLIRREGYELRTFYSGLPSGTPAVQAELFYGVCCAVPAFTFFDRNARRIFNMVRPECVKAVEERLQQRGEGLLKGGSSWGNIYCGGADPEESHFCAASIGWGDMLKSASILSFLLIIVMQIPAVLRALALLTVELVLAVIDFFRGLTHGGRLFNEFKFIFARVLIALGMREFVTIGARIDLARGLPIVHVNFLGYDEQAHHRGPSSLFAHWSLAGIDRAVQSLCQAARRSDRRDYIVWIFSDHGQESVRSYEKVHDGGLEAAIRRALEQWEKMTLSSHTSGRTSRAYWAGGKRAMRRLERHVAAEQFTPDLPGAFSVAAQGPVGHVYFEALAPCEAKETIANWLVSREKIPGVLFKDDAGEVIWVFREGRVRVPEEAAAVLPHPDGLKEIVARDLAALVANENSGDLVLLGWNPSGPPHWTFPIERGAHAGPGIDETQGFALLPPGVCLPENAAQFIRPRDLRAAILHVLRRKRIPVHNRICMASEPRRLKIMTYNVHSCAGMDGKVSPHRIARVIEMQRPDIIALQEIDLGRARSRWHDQARMIAEELGMHVSFCPTVMREKELYGHAILSRFPMSVARIGLLSGGPMSQRLEPRGALWVKVKTSDGIVNVVNTHFGLARFERAAQAADILGGSWIGGIGIDEPLIVCGDFNMPPGSLPYRSMTSRLKDAQTCVNNFRPLKTFAATYPFMRIDHIFVSSHFDVTGVLVPRNHLTRVASDHLPLVANLSFRLMPELPEAVRDPGTTRAAAPV